MNRRFVLKMLMDTNEVFKTLYIGIEMDSGSILHMFDSCDDISFRNTNSGRRVYVIREDLICVFFELENY